MSLSKTSVPIWIACGMVALLAGCNSSSSGSSSSDNGGSGGGGGASSGSALPSEHFFVGNDGSDGNVSDGSQLWKTDGTESGTTLVRTIAPGADAKMAEFTMVGDLLFFIADDGDGHGVQLWVSDGTESGTERLTDSSNLDAGSATTLNELDGKLYFRGRDGDGVWIWVSDGTPEGTGVIDGEVLLDQGLSLLTSFKDHLYFGSTDGDTGLELWRSDGTNANTDLVAKIQAGDSTGALFSCTDNLVALDGDLYFSADDQPSDGRCDLWRTNGDIGNVEKVKNIGETVNTGPAHLTATDDRLFFITGRDAETPEAAVWVSDGTEAGTQMVFEEDDDFGLMLGGSGATSINQPLTATSDRVYFYVQDKNKNSSVALQLWSADNSSSEMVVDLERSISGGEIDLGAVGSNLYFIAFANEDKLFRGLWKTNGSDPILLKPFSGGTSGGAPFIAASDDESLLFEFQGEMWRSNGTEDGTVQVKDICPGPCQGFVGAP